jgi:UDP-3-O-[3-hydroxymyristoyl] glucosamine N-acyltransferase
MLAALTIKTQHSDVFTYIGGNLERAAGQCDEPAHSSIGSLVYVSRSAQLADVMRRNPAIVIIPAQLAQAQLACRAGQAAAAAPCCFSVRSISIGMAVLLKYFDRKAVRFTQWGERHSTAVVHADAIIGAGAFLGPYCVIGANAVIGDGCLIGAHAVVENEAQIGAGTVIHPHVFVGSGCEIGARCEIHPHTTIGSDGFGYAVGADGKPQKITHLGNVKIGDEVEIGGNCAIDRGTLTSTRIGSRTKLDNLCHIAHNCDLGEDSFFTAGFMMGGSTKIGRGFVTGGNSVVTAHVTIADNVTLQGRSSVTNDILEAGAYGGYPLQPLKEAMKTAVSLGQLNEIRKNLHRVLKHLRLTERCPAQKVPDTSKS